jgi:hypothetical protein
MIGFLINTPGFVAMQPCEIFPVHDKTCACSEAPKGSRIFEFSGWQQLRLTDKQLKGNLLAAPVPQDRSHPALVKHLVVEVRPRRGADEPQELQQVGFAAGVRADNDVQRTRLPAYIFQGSVALDV